MKKAKPHATLIAQAPSHRVWFVQWPCLPWEIGDAFYVTSYPGAEFIAVEPATRRRKLKEKRRLSMMEAIRQAISSAEFEGA